MNNQQQECYVWVKASERLPKTGEGKLEYVFTRNIQSKCGGMMSRFELAKWEGLDNIEWLSLQPVSTPAPQEVLTEGKLYSREVVEKAWQAFRMRGFPHNTDSHGNETFEQFIKRLPEPSPVQVHSEGLKLYEFLYCPCIHESASATISIHLTKEGAEKAMERHKEEKRKEWQQIVDSDEDKGTDIGYDKICPFGSMEHWRISEINVQK